MVYAPGSDRDFIPLIKEVLASENGQGYSSWKERRPYFKFDRVEKPILFISTGLSANVCGAMEVHAALIEYIAQRDIEAHVEVVGSYGLMGLEPLVEVQLPGMARVAIANVQAQEVEALFDPIFNRFLPEGRAVFQHRNDLHQAWPGVSFMDDLPFFKQQLRVVLGLSGKFNPTSLPQYMANGGFFSFVKALRSYTFSDICDIVERSGLRGRAGSGFPTGKKWRMALEVAAESRYVVCNADESDPGAFMNRLIMEGSPYRVLEGLAIAAYACGAGKAFIYTRNRYSLAIQFLSFSFFMRCLGGRGSGCFTFGFPFLFFFFNTLF